MATKKHAQRTAHRLDAQILQLESQRYRWQRDTRYYEALLQRDLFGWVVIKVWGRIGSAVGQVRTIPVADYTAGEGLVAAISKRRLARRYTLLCGPNRYGAGP